MITINKIIKILSIRDIEGKKWFKTLCISIWNKLKQVTFNICNNINTREIAHVSLGLNIAGRHEMAIQPSSSHQCLTWNEIPKCSMIAEYCLYRKRSCFLSTKFRSFGNRLLVKQDENNEICLWEIFHLEYIKYILHACAFLKGPFHDSTFLEWNSLILKNYILLHQFGPF